MTGLRLCFPPLSLPSTLEDSNIAMINKGLQMALLAKGGL